MFSKILHEKCGHVARNLIAPEKIAYSVAILTLIGLITLQTAVTAGDEVFRALAVKGGVTLHHGNENSPLKAGQTIAAGDELELAAGGFAGLVAMGGSSVELKKAGKYKAGDLAKKYGGKSGSMAQKFATYIASQMTQQSSGTSTENYQTKMESTGAVERVNGGNVRVVDKTMELATGKKTEEISTEPESMPEKMQIIMPRTTKIMDGKVNFSWKHDASIPQYVVSVRNREHHVLFEESVTGNGLTVNLVPLGLSDDECYFWSVRPAGADDEKRSDEFALCTMTAAEQHAITDSLKILTSELGSTKTATAQLILASFYEQNELFTRAELCYREAALLAPDVDDVLIAGREFHKRQGIAE